MCILICMQIPHSKVCALSSFVQSRTFPPPVSGSCPPPLPWCQWSRPWNLMKPQKCKKPMLGEKGKTLVCTSHCLQLTRLFGLWSRKIRHKKKVIYVKLCALLKFRDKDPQQLVWNYVLKDNWKPEVMMHLCYFRLQLKNSSMQC